LNEVRIQPMIRTITVTGIFLLLAFLVGCSGVGDATPGQTPMAIGQGNTSPALSPDGVAHEPAPPPRELVYLEVTPAAAREVRAVARELKLERWWLRYEMEPAASCTGLKNKLDLDAGPLTDEVVECWTDGVPVIVLKSQRHLVQGTRIDFGEKDGKTGFIVTAPHASAQTKQTVSKWIMDEFYKRNPDLPRPSDANCAPEPRPVPASRQ
jgi:Fe-S cluster assembly iron-binding protein IscA